MPTTDVRDPTEGPWSRLTVDERAYAVARLALQVILVALYALDIVGSGDVLGRQLYLAALALQLCDTVVFFTLVFGLKMPAARAMMYVLIPDVVTGAAFTFLGRSTDAYYPVIFVTPILYAMSVPKRQAWFAGVLAALAYATGLAFIGPQTSALATVYFLKAAVIPVVTFLVAASTENQREREVKAEQCAAESEHLNSELRRRVHELQAVSDITDVVHSSLEFDEVGPEVLEILARAIGVETCCLFVIDKSHSETVFSASRGMTTDVSPVDGVVPINDAGDYLTCMPVLDHDPLMVLFCTTSESLMRLSDEDRLVLGAVASELVVAVENSRLYKLTSHLAVTDELTGLANYRFLQQRLDEELARAARYKKHMSLLMLDADDFKVLNDERGHVVGDAVLAELGAVIRRRVREVDIVARYGGEEFSIVLPETDSAGAFVVAEKIRESVELHEFADANGAPMCPLTVSVGLAVYPTHARDKDALLREADDALYHAKASGKNRVRTSQARAGTQRSDEAGLTKMSDELTGA